MVIINRILCPVDFSEFSRQALRLATAIAKDHGSALTVVHVVALPVPAFAPGVEWNAPLALPFGPEERGRLSTSLHEFVTSTAGTDVPIDVDVIEASSIAGEILAQARRLHADFIVMGTHGRGGFQRLVFGSVTEKVMRTAEQPVMTVGVPGIETAATSGAFSRVVCGVDFSDCSIAALGYALSLAEGAQAQLTAVNVLEWMPAGYDPMVGPTDLAGFHAAVERSAREQLHRIVTGLPTTNVHVEQTIRSGRPYHEILRLAAEQHAELIVLGIHGRNPIDRLLFGSTAEPIVRRAMCPVLTVRADVKAAYCDGSFSAHRTSEAHHVPCTTR
jgi:nucleotide-binding universal stress UspA family protein